MNIVSVTLIKACLIRMRTVLASIILSVFVAMAHAGSGTEYPVWQIETDLVFNSAIERAAGGNDYLYRHPSYLPPSQPQGLTDTGIFYELIRREGLRRLPKPALVPIAGSVTIFVPVYKPGKRMGDAYVERLFILNQISRKLGSQVIDQFRFGGEGEQINSLYHAAVRFALETGKVLGDPIDPEVETFEDMIWPEYRVIHGQRVLVPIVYLTQETVSTYAVREHRASFDGNTVQLGSLSVGPSAAVNLRAEYVQISDDLYLKGDLNVSEQNIQLVVGGLFDAVGGTVRAEADLVFAAGSMSLRPTIFVKRDQSGERHVLGQMTRIQANGHALLRAYGDLSVVASQVQANSITLAADGNVYIGAQPLQSAFEGHKFGWDVTRTEVDYIASQLSAEETIELIAGGHIQIDASEIVSSSGHIEMLGQLGVFIKDQLGQYQESKSGKFRRTRKSVEAYKTVAIRSLLDAGKGVVIRSDFGDISIRAINILSGEGTQLIAAQGGVNLLLSTVHDHYSYDSVRKNLLTTKTVSRGHAIETGVPNSIIGGIAVEAVSGLNIEFTGDPDLSFQEQLDQLSAMPGMDWVSQLQQGYLLDIDWALVEETYENWNETNRNLSPAAVALISIAVAVAVGPGAMDLANMVMASASGATATVGSAAIAGGITSLASQSAIILSNAALNGETNLYEIQKDIFTEENMINVATAMVTAAALSYLDSTFFEEVELDKLAEQQGVSSSQVDTGWLRNAEGQLNIAGQASHVVAEATTRATIQVLAEGNSLSQFGDDFKSAFEHNIKSVSVNRLGEITYGAIAEAEFDTSIEYIVLAGSGCVLGALSGTDSQDASNCYSGAGGAVIGKYVGDRVAGNEPTQEELSQLNEMQKQWLEENGIRSLEDYRQLQNGTLEEYHKLSHSFHRDRFKPITNIQRKGVNIARLSSGLMALVAGGNVDIAAEQAYFSVSNNVALAQQARVLQSVNLLEDYQRLLPLVELQEKLTEASTEQQVIQLIAEFSEMNPEYGHLKELSAHEALSALFNMVSDAGYAQEFAGLLDVQYHRLALTSEELHGDEVDRMVRDVIDDPTSTSYWELRAAAKNGEAEDQINSAIDRGFAQRFGVSECGAVGACVEASALFKSLLLMSGAEDLTGSAQAFFTEARPLIEATGDPYLLKAFDSAFGYFSAASEILVEGGAGIAQITEMSASSVLMLVDMSIHAVTGSEDTKEAYIHALRVAVDVADTTQFLWEHRASLPSMAKDAWDDYSRQIEEAEAQGDWLTAEKLRSKRAYYTVSILFPAARMGSGQLISIGRAPSLQERFPDLTPNELALLSSRKTFETRGVTVTDADRFLSSTPEGRRLLDMMESQNSAEDAYLLALNFVQSGMNPPVMRNISSPLIKIVPTEGTLSARTGYWTTEAHLRSVIESGQPLADAFGLPLANHNVRYGVFEIRPRDSVVVFESVVAPTSELGGKVTTRGGAVQIIVPDRRQFHDPVLVEVITDN